jgi:HK97 family phage prohead protease
MSETFFKQAEITLGEDERSARFVASSNSIDRYGDIVEQEWDLANFWRNPVFLWAHNSWRPPIGTVREFATNNERTQTVARVEFMPAGIDAEADKLCRMVQLKLIRAVSVGFRALEIEDRLDDRGRWDGYRFLRSELIELSLCTIPANQDAIQLAKSIDPDPRFLRRVFADGIIRANDPQPVSVPGDRFPLRDRALADLARMKAA